MKPSDAGLVTRHLEKIILGLGVLALIIISLMFVLGEPYAVEVRGRPGGVAPRDLEEIIVDAAENLETNLQRQGQFEVPRIPDYTQEFQTTYEQDVAGAMRLATIGGAALPPGMTGAQNINTPYRRLPEVPMPLSIVARADHALLDASQILDPNTATAYRRLTGNAVPADFRYVDVGATFDLGEWEHRFSQVPADQRVPDHFVRNSLYVTGVYLIRQTQDPITKRWGRETLIPALPDQIQYLPDTTRRFTDVQAEAAGDAIRDSQRLIAQPEFPPLADESRLWNPPTANIAELTLEQRRDLSSLTKRARTLRSNIERAHERQAKQAERQSRAGDTQRPRRESSPTPQVDPRNFDPRQAVSPPTQRQRPTRRGDSAGRGAPVDRLSGWEEELQDVEWQIQSLRQGLDPDTAPAIGPGGYATDPNLLGGGYPPIDPTMWDPSQGRIDGSGAAAPEAAPTRQFDVWAHDLTVEPGRTYRYKIVVAVMNPLFNNKRLHPDQLAANMHRISLVPGAIEIDDAPWSEPVHVDPDFFFFAVAGNAKRKTAKVEVFRIFNGVWRQHNFDVQPGDPIGGEIEIDLPGKGVRAVDMRVDAYVVDVESTPGTHGGMGGVRLLYLDPLTNRIVARDVGQDKNADERDRLRFEVQEAEALSQSAQVDQDPRRP